jgi:hypothetical protein
MRTGNQKPPRYILKIRRRNYVLRLAWWIIRRYALNEDYYKCVTRYTGPRPRYAYSTKKKDATAYRYYLEPRVRAARVPHVHRISNIDEHVRLIKLNRGEL